jgi:hypothetical protein
MLMRTAAQRATALRQFPTWSDHSTSIGGAFDLRGARISYARNAEIYGEEETGRIYLQSRQRGGSGLQASR